MKILLILCVLLSGCGDPEINKVSTCVTYSDGRTVCTEQSP